MGVIQQVGAGPGAKGLITLRGASLLGLAGAVLHDRGLSRELLALAGSRTELVEAAATPEARVGQLAELAARYELVVRLLSGDGATSGGAASERALLQVRGLSWEVVPGVALEAAGVAYAGVVVGPASPLAAARIEGGAGTRGDQAGEARLVLHDADTVGQGARSLLAGGLPADASALVVRAPGTAAQQIAEASLGQLAARVASPREAAGAGEAPAGAGASDAGSAPAVLLAARSGTVSRVPWFETRPLFGRRVVVTRPRAQAAAFLEWLEGQGAEPVAFPAIRIVPPPDPAPLARAAAEVRGYAWLVFTSVNGVERFWAALESAGLDTRALGQAQVAAIGPATAAALRERGVSADVVPERYVAESVVDALSAAGNLRGRRVLLPRAAGAREILPQRLAELGAVVTEVEAYRSEADASEAAELQSRLGSDAIDVVTFTSSSTVRNFVAAVGTRIGRAIVACIGPITAATAREVGLPVMVVAAEHTVPGLQVALLEHFSGGGPGAGRP